MRLAVAQLCSVRGDIAANLAHHLQWVATAVKLGAEALIFPELSLTGYEPALATSLAMQPNDERLQPLQAAAQRDRLTIGVGLPLLYDHGVGIGLLLFHPHGERQVYTKRYLHADEEPFFIPGHPATGVITTIPQVALAICYELSIPAHATCAVRQGAQIYLASAAKSAAGVTQAHQRLRAIAQQSAMSTILVNCVGACEGFVGAGGSAIWQSGGKCLAQLDDHQEGLLGVDTTTFQVTSSPRYLK